MASTREDSTAYVLGEVIVPSTLSEHWYICTVPGTTGVGEPVWANFDRGDIITDGTAKFKVEGSDGGVVALVRIAYSTFAITFTARNLEVTRSVGKPDTNFQGTNQLDPRGYDILSSEDVFQISGQLIGPVAYEEALILGTSIIQPRKQLATMTLTFSGAYARAFGASHTVQGSGSNACRIAPANPGKDVVQVDLQLKVVDNS